MLKENWRLISRVERIGDCLIVIFSFFLAYYGRDSLLFWDQLLQLNLPFGGPTLAPLRDYIVVLGAALVAYGAALSWLGAYTSMRMSSAWHLLRITVVASVITFMAISSVVFLLKVDLSRSFMAIFCGLAAIALAAQRYVVLSVLRFWRRRGRNFRNIIVCGVGEQALKLATEIEQRPELGLRIRAFVDLRTSQNPYQRDQEMGELQQFREALRRLGGPRVRRILLGIPALERALRTYAIDEIIFTDVVRVMAEVQEVVQMSSEQGIRTTIAADLFSVGMVKSGISYFGEMPLIHYHTPPGDLWELSVKRSIDIFISGALLAALSPLLLLIAIGIKCTSRGPVIFSQRRVGLNGRLFSLYKFRSMARDAELQLDQLKKYNEMSGPVFKMRNDPRVTKLGGLLRRYSLDELPQLWNVFVGDMSLVGPRPPVPGEVSLYERRDRRRLSMRPGMTCSWQVSGRNEITDFDAWVKLDLEYIDNWSLWRDFMLLLRTIPAVILGHGAH